MKKLCLILAIALISCEAPSVESIAIQKWTVDTIWRAPIVSVHDEINPDRQLARLSNGDTLPVSKWTKIGDTIEYRILKLKKR